MIAFAATALQLLGGAGSVTGVEINTGGSAGWLQLFDAAAEPPDGAVTPLKAWQIAAGVSIRWPLNVAVNNGAWLVFSATGAFVKTAQTAAVLSGEAVATL
jgi:hypothetical protein